MRKNIEENVYRGCYNPPFSQNVKTYIGQVKVKDESKNFNISWKISMYTKAYKYGLKPCDLCVTEKYVTARADQENLPNKRTEIVSKYCH